MDDARAPQAPWPDDEFVDYAQARQHTLLRAAYLVCGDLRLAEQLVRDALVQLARQWDRVREEQPDLFVRRIVYRDAVASWRQRPHEEIAAVPAVRTSPTQPWDADEVERRREVLRALDALTPRQRAVVVLRWFEERGEGDVAEVLGCSAAHRARRGRRGAGPAARRPAARRPRHRGRAMTADLRELLELASDDVPDLDLAHAGLGRGRAPAPGRRAAHRAGRGRWRPPARSSASSCATAPRRPVRGPDRRGHGRPRTAGCRRRRSTASPSTSHPTRPTRRCCRATRMPRASQIPRHLGPADPPIRAELGPGGGVAEPLRAVFLVVAEGGGYHLVLFAPDAPFQVEVPGAAGQPAGGRAVGPRPRGRSPTTGTGSSSPSRAAWWCSTPATAPWSPSRCPTRRSRWPAGRATAPWSSPEVATTAGWSTRGPVRCVEPPAPVNPDWADLAQGEGGGAAAHVLGVGRD